jgi:hypothetical protein
VKGAKRLGVPVCNWLTAEQSKRLLLTANSTSLRGKRDYATLAILLGCGLRRAELTAVNPPPGFPMSGLSGALAEIKNLPRPVVDFLAVKAQAIHKDQQAKTRRFILSFQST